MSVASRTRHDSFSFFKEISSSPEGRTLILTELETLRYKYKKVSNELYILQNSTYKGDDYHQKEVELIELKSDYDEAISYLSIGLQS